MNHFFIDIIFLFIILVILSVVYFRQKRCKEISNNLIKILSKNVDFLTEFYKKQEVLHLKNTINLYSQFQVILKISKCDFISFFKYDYSRRYIMLHFIISIDDKGTINQESSTDDLPASSNLLTLNIMNADDKDLYSIVTEDLKEKSINTYQMMNSKGIKKVFYQNIFNDRENPLGFIAISYKDENYDIPEGDKVEILRIIQKIKAFI